LNSACLEFFEFIRREPIKPLINHLVENYRDKIKNITYVDTFSNFIHRYDETPGFVPNLSESFADTEDDTPKRPETGRGNRWDSGIKDLDAVEEEYFNTSDDEDETNAILAVNRASTNGASPVSKPLVDYNSDEENEAMDAEMNAGILPANGDDSGSSDSKAGDSDGGGILTTTSSTASGPPERLSEKRRREEDDEDELGKLVQQNKRRNSSSSAGSNTSVLRRKKSFSNSSNGGASSSGSKPSKIAISLSPAIELGASTNGSDENST
jgi:protein phosphatase-4 regulatory subunit 3